MRPSRSATGLSSMKALEEKRSLIKKSRWHELKGEDEVDHEVMDNNWDNIQSKKYEKEMKRKL